jgi:hypothetical protein
VDAFAAIQAADAMLSGEHSENSAQGSRGGWQVCGVG